MNKKLPANSLNDPAVRALKAARGNRASGRRPPIRLVKVLTSFYFGGTEKQTMNLIRRMNRSVFDLRIASMNKRGHYLRELVESGIDVREYAINSFFKPNFLYQQSRFITHLRREKIQVVHSYNFYANVFSILAARLAGVPVVIASIRDCGIYLTPSQKRVQKFICRFADAILVNAESIREWLIDSGYDEGKIILIRNGIDCHEYNVKPDEGGGLRAQYNLPDSTPLIMLLTRITPQKGIDDFLAAAVKISRRFPNARFLVVGDKIEVNKRGVSFINPEYRKMRNLRDKLGLGERVIFTGYRVDVPELLAQVDVSILPSHSEGLSNSLLEAMAAGVPVVATRVGGNPELITDQITGLLTPPRDPDALAAAISSLLQDPERARAMGMRGREFVRSRFSFEDMTRGTQRIYIDFLEKKLGKKINHKRGDDIDVRSNQIQNTHRPIARRQGSKQ